jgi:CheY-like chemotaxis protein
VSPPVESDLDRDVRGVRHEESRSRLDERSRLDRVRVLVVDDTPHVRDVVRDILTEDSAKVTAVASAEEALTAPQCERPDLLVSDLAMPGKGGYWLIQLVRALPPERGGGTPAAALTAFTGPEHRASVLRAGFQLHVEKPVGLEALIGGGDAGAEGKRAIAIEQVRADSEILTAPADQHRGTTGVLPIDQVCRRST